MNTAGKILFDTRIKRKNVLALNEKVAAIREFEKTPVYKHVGRSFNCSPDQIKRIIQQKDQILSAWEQRTRRCNEVKSLEMKSVRVSMLGKAVYEWIRRMMYYKDFIITDGLIQKMALQFKSALGICLFFPHQDWCDKFRQMYKIDHSDTKKLSIAHAQGRSVQIKDIIRDILIPEHDDHVERRCKESELDTDTESITSIKHEDSDQEERCPRNNEEQTNKAKNRTKKCDAVAKRRRQLAKKTVGCALKTALGTTPALPKRQLLALKLNNGSKLPQQVLVATPITPLSNGSGSAPPMTMTIIPLASVAQSLNSAKPQLPSVAPAPVPHKPLVPPPKLEIKREIIDEEEKKEEKQKDAATTEPMVQIKKECISDDEDDHNENTAPHNTGDAGYNALPEAMECTTPKIEPTPIDSLISGTGDEQDEDEDEEDNLALAQLQKGLAKKCQSNNSDISSSNHNSTCGIQNIAANDSCDVRTPTPPSLPRLPAMPPLTRAPTAAKSTSSNKRRHVDCSPALPPIATCAEARKYLKLLEDFALVKENFRLIGLITRADEVLRELDGDEDVDVV